MEVAQPSRGHISKIRRILKRHGIEVPEYVPRSSKYEPYLKLLKELESGICNQIPEALAQLPQTSGFIDWWHINGRLGLIPITKALLVNGFSANMREIPGLALYLEEHSFPLISISRSGWRYSHLIPKQEVPTLKEIVLNNPELAKVFVVK